MANYHSHVGSSHSSRLAHSAFLGGQALAEGSIAMGEFAFDPERSFRMDHYREHIMSILGWDSMLFSNMTPLTEDSHLDKIWRFITLIYMENDREVELTQHGSDLRVQRVYNEAYG